MNVVFFFSALGILLWFFALLYLRSYVKRHAAADYILAAHKQEVALLKADIDEKTEQNLELLEDRITALRELLAETEKRITVYAREVDRLGAREAVYTALRPEGEPPPPKRKKPPKTAVPAVSGNVKSGRRGGKGSLLDSIEIHELSLAQADNAYRAAARPAAPAEKASAPAPVSAEPPASVTPAVPRVVRPENPVVPKAPPLRERVAQLYRAGFSEELIASRLGISVSEARSYAALAEGDA